MNEKFPSSVLNKTDKIFAIGEINGKTINYLHDLGKCVVVYNFFEKNVQVAKVNNDERLQYKLMTEYFIKAGHTQIACINGANLLSENIERYMGFQDAMITNDLFIESKFVKWGDMTPESGYVLTKELMKLPQTPTVIICVNDGVVMGAYDALEEMGYVVGKDVMLSGHDNHEPIGKKYAVSTIDPDYESVGKQIAEILKRETWLDDEVILPGKLIIR
jgi:LacI family transcriptional regulator